METSGSSAGKDSLGKETCWMAAKTENSAGERQRHGTPGARRGEGGRRAGGTAVGQREGMRAGERGSGQIKMRVETRRRGARARLKGIIRVDEGKRRKKKRLQGGSARTASTLNAACW